MGKVSVSTSISPYFHSNQYLYTAYYRHCINEYLTTKGWSFVEKSNFRHVLLLRALRRLDNFYFLRRVLGRFYDRYSSFLDKVAHIISGRGDNENSCSSDLGRYELTKQDGTRVKIFLDHLDTSEVTSPDGLEWCDIYFKTSFGSEKTYPEKVKPFYQCSLLLLKQAGRLIALRESEKIYDICCTMRLWGGSSDVEGIEHNLRILEALSKVPCRKFLRAYLLAGNTDSYARRLDKAGVPWSMHPLPLKDHLKTIAQSHFNIHRLGMHNSITWRMSEMLCMGACPVLDQPPRTIWPRPLQEKIHFLSLDLRPPGATWVASDNQYEAIPERVEAFIAEPGLASQISANNVEYFDENLSPLKIGCQFVELAGK